jgi:hypothetical protein
MPAAAATTTTVVVVVCVVDDWQTTYTTLSLSNLGTDQFLGLFEQSLSSLFETCLIKELTERAGIPVTDRKDHQGVIVLDEPVSHGQSLGRMIGTIYNRNSRERKREINTNK